jgi:lipopolysaccharide transport system permease protein
MLLALRRWLGMSTPVVQEADGVIDRRAQKWVIEPARVGLVARVEELWRYRRILWFFASRRIKERYEDKTLGRFWMFFQPLAPILISTMIFGNLLGVPSDGVPYFLFFLAGMSCWRIFERGVIRVTRSLDQNRGLIKKVYFPRLIAPISSVAPALTEFGILFTLLVLTCFYYYFKDGVFYLRLGPQMLVGLLAIAMAAFLSISVGLWTTVLQVRHKDVKYSIRYFMQLWHYVTPVIFPLSELLKTAAAAAALRRLPEPNESGRRDVQMGPARDRWVLWHGTARRHRHDAGDLQRRGCLLQQFEAASVDKL